MPVGCMGRRLTGARHMLYREALFEVYTFPCFSSKSIMSN
jgi:hypothetical protein